MVKEIAGKTNPPIAQIAEHIKEVYQQKRLQILESQYLRSRGINHKFFIEAGAKLLPQAIYNQIDYAFATFMLPLEALIAGTDESGPRIYGIRNPGLVDCYNSIGFHAIGTGTMHALLSLIETYDPEASEMETMYSVFRAKKVAEVAPGVGEETDLGMVIFKQKLKFFDKNTEIFKILTKLYDDEKNARKDLITRSKLATLNISDEGKLTEKPTNKEVQSKPEKVKE